MNLVARRKFSASGGNRTPVIQRVRFSLFSFLPSFLSSSLALFVYLFVSYIKYSHVTFGSTSPTKVTPPERRYDVTVDLGTFISFLTCYPSLSCPLSFYPFLAAHLCFRFCFSTSSSVFIFVHFASASVITLYVNPFH